TQKETPQEADSNEVKKELTCSWSYSNEATTVNWTAYKFTEKAGVKGAFDSIRIQANSGSADLKSLLSEASFEIPVSSVNTANPDRDQKIRKFFFGNLKNSDLLKGKVTAVNGEGEEGDLEINL